MGLILCLFWKIFLFFSVPRSFTNTQWCVGQVEPVWVFNYRWTPASSCGGCFVWYRWRYMYGPTYSTRERGFYQLGFRLQCTQDLRVSVVIGHWTHASWTCVIGLNTNGSAALIPGCAAARWPVGWWIHSHNYRYILFIIQLSLASAPLSLRLISIPSTNYYDHDSIETVYQRF